LVAWKPDPMAEKMDLRKPSYADVDFVAAHASHGRNAKLTDIKCYGLTYGLMWLLLVKLDAKKAGQLLRALQS
jgi:hypothetical protein